MDKHDKRHNPKHATKHDASHPERASAADVPVNAGKERPTSGDLAPTAKAKDGMRRRPFSDN